MFFRPSDGEPGLKLERGRDEVPLLGWAGISDFGAREIFLGYSLPAIWPEGAGYDALLLEWHAYFAFGLLALVALHIGVAIHDYMTNEWSAHRPPE